MANPVGRDKRIPRGQLWAANPVEPTAWPLRTAARFTPQANGNLVARPQKAACSVVSCCCRDAEVQVGGDWQGWLRVGRGICGGKGVKNKESR